MSDGVVSWKRACVAKFNDVNVEPLNVAKNWEMANGALNLTEKLQRNFVQEAKEEKENNNNNG